MGEADAVGWLAEAPSHTCLFADFDGTLSHIVRRPELARPLPGVPEVLERLARLLLAVGVLSGRPAAWLVEQLGFGDAGQTGLGQPVDGGRSAGGSGAAAGDGAPEREPVAPVAAGIVQVYGLHGIEHATGSGGIDVADGARTWRAVLAGVRVEALAAAIAGLEVEDKQYGVTLHWRGSAEPGIVAERATRLAERLTASTGLQARPGKASVELVAPIGVDKGSVLRSWAGVAGVERIAFVGDDTSDLAGFRVIDQLVRSGAIAGLKIAVTGTEVPAELLERADLVLEAPERVVGLLVRLADRLEGGQGGQGGAGGT